MHGLPVLANTTRWEQGSFTGPVSRSGSHDLVKCLEAMSASTSTSLCFILFILSPLAAEVLKVALIARPCVGSGYPHLTPSTRVSVTGWVGRRDHLAVSRISCRCNTGSTQNQGRVRVQSLVSVSSQVLFKGRQFLTLQSSQAGSSAKRWLYIFFPAVQRNWD